MRITSPKTTTPSAIPATGSAAVIAGRDAFSGAALNELSISHMAERRSPRPGCRRASWSAAEPAGGGPAISTVRRVSASEMPKTRPAAAPVSVARGWPDRRQPARRKQNAIPRWRPRPTSTGEAAEPHALGVAPTGTPTGRRRPPPSSSAPSSSERRSRWPVSGTASSRANSRLVASSGSATVSSRWPMAHIDSPWPGGHDPDAGQPAALAQQLGDQPEVQEVGLGDLLGGLLLEDQAGPDQHGGDQGHRDVHESARARSACWRPALVRSSPVCVRCSTGERLSASTAPATARSGRGVRARSTPWLICSPKTTTPQRVETIGSTSVIPGWDAVSGPA